MIILPLIGKKEIKLMKPTAFLINTARGEIIDQTALTNTLRQKKIGAALDVFENESLEPNHPLVGLDNVILSTHGLAITDELIQGKIKGLYK